jgi:hypothetical protein
VSYCFRARVTVDANTAVTSAGSTVSHYKIGKKKVNQRLFIELESNESVVAYYSLPRH